MDFIHWWFAEHWIWSTILTPWTTAVWCIFTDNGWRFIVALFCGIVWIFVRMIGRKK